MPQKLFVWECPLGEYSSGIAAAMAPDLKTAVAALIVAGLPEHYFVPRGGIMTDSAVVYPKVYEQPTGVFNI